MNLNSITHESPILISGEKPVRTPFIFEHLKHSGVSLRAFEALATVERVSKAKKRKVRPQKRKVRPTEGKKQSLNKQNGFKNFIELIDHSDKGKEIRTFFLANKDVLWKGVNYGNPILVRKITQLGKRQLELKSLITEVAHRILLAEHSDHFITNGELRVTCLKDLLHYVSSKMEMAADVEPEKVAACKVLTTYIVSLRIVHEIRKANIAFPKTAPEDAKTDFSQLKKYKSTNAGFKYLQMVSSRLPGKKAADCYTEEWRHKASILDAKEMRKHLPTFQKNSPYDLLCGTKPNILATLVRKVVGNIYKNNSDFIVSNDDIFSRIRRDYAVGQFPPTLVYDVIEALKSKYGFNFKSIAMLDPCAGWAARLVAALAHPDITTYTGVDPNPNLAFCYDQVREAYDPEHLKQVFIHTKKIEDVEIQELAQFEKQIKYQLILTSPPYGMEHYYEGQTDYGQTEKLNELFAGLFKTAALLSKDGFMVINLGNLDRCPLADLFQKYLIDHQEETHLKWIETVTIKSKGRYGQNNEREKLIIARKESE